MTVRVDVAYAEALDEWISNFNKENGLNVNLSDVLRQHLYDLEIEGRRIYNPDRDDKPQPEPDEVIEDVISDELPDEEDFDFMPPNMQKAMSVIAEGDNEGI